MRPRSISFLSLLLAGAGTTACLAEDFIPAKPLAEKPLGDYVQYWPEGVPPTVTRKDPLAFLEWDKPYNDDLGRRWVERINLWFRERTAAGLSQDTFRSFDNGHSSIGKAYPQLTFAPPADAYFPSDERVFAERVTLGVQSLGFHQSPFGEPLAITEFFSRASLLHQLDPALFQRTTNMIRPPGTQGHYRTLYENNLLLVTPAVWNYPDVEGGHQDRFSLLSPFYLHSIGKSGSDAHLIKPIIYAAAALPPEVKTRALRSGAHAALLGALFRKHVGQGLRHESSHRAAFALPEGPEAGARFMDALLNDAHGLKHVPPVARLKVQDVKIAPGKPGFLADYRYLLAVALRQGQTLEATVDVGESWIDPQAEFREGYASVLRDPMDLTALQAEFREALGRFTERHPLVIQLRGRMKEAGKDRPKVEKLDERGARWKIRVPWREMGTSPTAGARTDLLFLVNDGTHDSAPAYISVRHMQASDAWAGGAK